MANRKIIVVPWIEKAWLYCLGREHLHARADGLGAHGDGDARPDAEEHERRADVLHADVLVVGAHEPGGQAARLACGRRSSSRGRVDVGHFSSSR